MNKTIYKKLLIFYVIAILVVSTIPGSSIKIPSIWSFDKLLHLIEYFILAFLAINALESLSTKTVVIIVIIGTLYGGFNEVWQGAIGRNASIYDAIANGVGMILGSIITLKYLLFSNN